MEKKEMVSQPSDGSESKRSNNFTGLHDIAIHFRNALTSDAATIQEIACKTWPKTYGEILSSAQLDYMLEKLYSLDELLRLMSTDNRFIIAENTNNEAMAFAAFSQHNSDRLTFHLHKLYVLPQFQNLHCGRMLMERVIEEIKNLGGTRLHLNVNRHNRARHFYEKLGFKILHEEDIDIGNGYFMNDYLMEKHLY